MSNPVRRLKAMPWLTLLQAAALTAFFAVILYLMLIQAITNVPALARSLAVLFSPPLGMILVIAAAFGVGALAVYLMERVFQTLIINTANLWGLILCLILVLVVKSMLSIPNLLIEVSQTSLLGIVVGVFVSSRKYWRR